jgi:hypothetical protein
MVVSTDHRLAPANFNASESSMGSSLAAIN